MFPVEANAVFVRLSDAHAAAMRDKGWIFYRFIGGGARFMFAWDTRDERIDELARDLKAVAAVSARCRREPPSASIWPKIMASRPSMPI